MCIHPPRRAWAPWREGGHGRGMDLTPSASCHPCCSPVWWPSFTHFLGEDIEAFRVRGAPRDRLCRWDPELCLASLEGSGGLCEQLGSLKLPQRPRRTT